MFLETPNCAVQPTNDTRIRVYFFTDQSSRKTLLANLLPFTSSNPAELKELDLVYQHKNHWVYKIGPEAAGMARATPNLPVPSG